MIDSQSLISMDRNLCGEYLFFDVNNPSVSSDDINIILNKKNDREQTIELDLSGLVFKTCSPFLLGNRTLVSNVKRVPWMSSYSESEKKYVTYNLPDHGYAKPDRVDFTNKLKSSLLEEAALYIGTADTIGILLSGGMDSRVVAGVVKELQNRTGYPKHVVALTWGAEHSRDFIYAKKIAKIFQWDFHYVPVTVDDLKNNIEISGERGAEYSGVHLHSLPKVSNISGLDLILAGSYGDMIGRAEFSGVHLSNLKPIFKDNFDKFSIIKKSAFEKALPNLYKDVETVSLYDRSNHNHSRYEAEQAMHYMRRMLQSCMSVVNSKTPLYQMFTAPSVFSLMWGLSPSERNDDWYKYLLSILPGNLLDIPWARTGRVYLSKDGTEDSYSKSHHCYGTWLRNDLKDLITERVNSDSIRELGIFNNFSLDLALSAWSKSNTKSISSLDETMSWLASLYVFINKHNIKKVQNFESSHVDIINSISGGFNSYTYIAARNFLRK